MKDLFTRFSQLSDANTSLRRLMWPEYPGPCGKITNQEIRDALLRVNNYPESATLFRMIDFKSGEIISGYFVSDPDIIFEQADFRFIRFERSVTYTGMMRTD